MPEQVFAHLGITATRRLLHLFRLIVNQVLAVVFALDFVLNPFHFLSLSIPLISSHFRLPFEQFFVWLAITSSQAIPQRRKLTIIVFIVEIYGLLAES